MELNPVKVLPAIRVLLLDDEPYVLELAKIALTDADPGIEVTTSSDPAEVLGILRRGGVDCVVSDYQMPGMDGIRFTAEARKASPVPIILYTGHGTDEVKALAGAAGADDYISKEPGLDHYRRLAERIRLLVEASRALD